MKEILDRGLHHCYINVPSICEDCGNHIEDDERGESWVWYFDAKWLCDDCYIKHKTDGNRLDALIETIRTE